MPQMEHASEHARLAALVVENLRNATGLRLDTTAQELSFYARDAGGDHPIDLNIDPRADEKFSVQCYESTLAVILLMVEVVMGIRFVKKHHAGDPILHFVRADQKEITMKRAVPEEIMDRASHDTGKTNTPPPEPKSEPPQPGRYPFGRKPGKP